MHPIPSTETGLGISGRLAAFFQQNPLTPLLALLLLLMGVFAVWITPKEEEPQIDVTMANVIVPFPGASVAEVEAKVAKPAEQVLSRMKGVEHVYSVSRPGMAVITVQFAVGVPNQTALVRLYDTVESHKDWFGAHVGVGEPIVKPKGIDDVPIVSLTLWAEEESPARLRDIARSLETEIKRIRGTRDVVTLGGADPVVRVLPDIERMNAYGMTLSMLRHSLQLSNLSLPSGYLVRDNQSILVETGQWFDSVSALETLVVASPGGVPVYLRDVATLEEGPDEPQNQVWFGNKDVFVPAVTVAVSKQPGANAADVSRAVLERVDALKEALLPEDVHVTVTRDYGQTADEKARTLIGKLAFATGAVVLLVFFALGRREAVVVGVAVILTLAATLFASWAWGFTLNRVSLFALIFSIGILVDDAIVVVENIHRWHVLEPEKPLWALIPKAVDEVGGPTILATFTVIAALLPMAFVSGLMGPYMSPIPINASMGMFISLAIAFIVTPWLALRFLKAHPNAQPVHGVAAHAGPDRLERFFTRVMQPLIESRTRRWLLWLSMIALVMASMALPAFQLVVMKMLPFDNKSEFQVILDMPNGTPVEETARVLGLLGQELNTVPEVAHWQLYAGLASPINFNGLVRQYDARQSPELGDIQVSLRHKSERTRQSHPIAQSIATRLAQIAEREGGQAFVVEVPPGPPVMAPIVAEIYGPDLEGQMQVAGWVRKAFEATPDLMAIDDSIDASAPRKRLWVDQVKAARLGISVAEVVQTIHLALSGESVSSVHGTGRSHDVPVRIRLSPEKRADLSDVLTLKIGTPEGGQVSLSELVRVVETTQEQTRYRKDLLPVVYVTADMAGALDSPLYGLFDIHARLTGQELAGLNQPGVSGLLEMRWITPPQEAWSGYTLKWDGEWKITYETFRDMGAAYGVGLLLIYLLVVAHFRSYLIPLVIMAPIPLTMAGVMPGHALLGAQFTATSMIGMIALAGIIVRNSILLVDFIREDVANGVPIDRALIRGAAIRAKPIGLTALAAMIGALFILDDPIFNGLAISLIFGVFVSTLLTLVVIPMLYYSLISATPKPPLKEA
jgi:multidrug efflux pump subunit AcrB